MQVLQVVDSVDDGDSLAISLLDGSVVEIGVLGEGVIAPDDQVVDVFNSALRFVSNLGESSVLVKSSQSGEVSLGQGRSVVGGDQGVCVCGVSDNENLHSLLGNLVESFSLSLEDGSICGQEIFSLHAGTSGSSSDQHGGIAILEAGLRAGVALDVGEEGESSVSKLHSESLQGSFGLRKLDELKNNLLVGSKHPALSDHEAEEESNLASSTGNCYSERGFLILQGGEVSAEGGESSDG